MSNGDVRFLVLGQAPKNVPAPAEGESATDFAGRLEATGVPVSRIEVYSVDGKPVDNVDDLLAAVKAGSLVVATPRIEGGGTETATSG